MSKFKILKDNKGLTLVEMMVSLVLMAIVTVAVLQIFTYSMNAYNKQMIQSEQLIILEETERNITDFLRYAQSVEVADSLDIGIDGKSNSYAIYTDTTDNSFRYIEKDKTEAEAIALTGGDGNITYNVEVLFRYYTDDVLEAKITVFDDLNKNTMSSTIHCKILNMSIAGSTGITGVLTQEQYIIFS